MRGSSWVGSKNKQISGNLPRISSIRRKFHSPVFERDSCFSIKSCFGLELSKTVRYLTRKSWEGGCLGSDFVLWIYDLTFLDSNFNEVFVFHIDIWWFHIFGVLIFRQCQWTSSKTIHFGDLRSLQNDRFFAWFFKKKIATFWNTENPAGKSKISRKSTPKTLRTYFPRARSKIWSPPRFLADIWLSRPKQR